MLLAHNVDLDQVRHCMVSDLGLHCFSMAFYGFPSKDGFKKDKKETEIKERKNIFFL